MDPISMGAAIATIVVTQLGKKIVEKGSDPKMVAKGVNWLFGTVDEFLKNRKTDKVEIAPPPEQVKKGKAKKIKPLALSQFEMELLQKEISASLDQLSIYLNNLAFEESKAAQYGGVELAPIIVRNTISLQHQKIIECMNRLNTAVQSAYGVSTNLLQILEPVTTARL